jgi:hypothetical protein
MAWCETTPSDEVRAVLQTVALREGEHGLAFAKRICELGYSVIPKDDPKQEERMALVRSSKSDLEKFDTLLLGNADGPDVFDGMFKDHTIDIQTGALLGRYIAEERDSGRLLRNCRDQLRAAEGGSSLSGDRLASMEGKVDELCRAVDELRDLVCAQTMSSESGSNSGRPKAKSLR